MRYITDTIALARQIIRVEAPRVKLRVLQGRAGQLGQSCWVPSKRRIDWYAADGLTALIHEIAHAQLKHKVHAHRLNKPNRQELDAWQRAEIIAHHWGLAFDYWFAEFCLTTHTPSVVFLTDAFKVQWRYAQL